MVRPTAFASWFFLAAVLGVGAGCSLSSGGTANGARDGADDGSETDGGPCDTPEAARCAGSVLQRCTDGAWTDDQQCAEGCGGDPAHCLGFAPSFVENPEEAFIGTGTIALQSPATGTVHYTIDTDSGKVTNEDGAIIHTGADGIENGVGVVRQDQAEGAPGLLILSLHSLTVPDGVALRVVGERAIVLLATGDVTIDGEVDVSADQSKGGPGGRTAHDTNLEASPLCGAAGEFTAYDEQNGLYLRGGGGGGGNLAGGGVGGAYVLDENNPTGSKANGGAAGTAASSAPTALVGGGCGGAGRFSSPPMQSYVKGGGGGGAMLIASQSKISIGGRIRAAGAGGRSSNFTPANARPFGSGGGGGAGGTILLEAPAIEVTGQLYANGGGGGSSNGWDTADGNAGEPGQDGAQAAKGGAGRSGNGEDGSVAGGNGGALANPAGSPGKLGYALAGGGSGGGGGAGRIELHGTNVTTNPSGVSPAVTVKTLPMH